MSDGIIKLKLKLLALQRITFILSNHFLWFMVLWVFLIGVDLRCSCKVFFKTLYNCKKTVRQKNFGGLLILDSPRHVRSFADFRKLKWVSTGQIFNNVDAQKKTAPEFPCGLNSVEKYFREIGSFSGVIRVHVVIV